MFLSKAIKMFDLEILDANFLCDKDSLNTFIVTIRWPSILYIKLYISIIYGRWPAFAFSPRMEKQGNSCVYRIPLKSSFPFLSFDRLIMFSIFLNEWRLLCFHANKYNLFWLFYCSLESSYSRYFSAWG